MPNTPNVAPTAPAVASKPVAPAAKTVVPTPKPVVPTPKAPVVETKPALKAVPKPPEAEKAAAEAPKAPVAEETDTYVINGKEYQLTKTQAKTFLQKAGAVADKFRLADEAQKKAQALISELEADPEAALKKLGKDPNKIFDQYLKKMAQQASLTPEQIETQRQAEELAQFKAKEEQAREEQRKAAEQKLQEQETARWEQKFVNVAQKYGLPANPDTVEQLAAISYEFGELGLALTEDQLAAEFQLRHEERISSRDQQLLARFPNTDEGNEALIKYLGEDLVKRVIRQTLKSIPKPEAKTVEASAPVRVQTKSAPIFNKRDFDKAIKDAQSTVSPKRGVGR